MESYGLDMEDIFDTEADLDDDLAAPRPMPDLEDDEEPINRNLGEGQEDGDEDAPDADVLSKLKDISKGAAKKKVMRPQPKLDLERLQSKRGLRALPAAFEGVKFKGKGHEVEDLGLLMGKLEHWAHRLFPKLPFDDFVERLEKLGAKKQVQTCIKRIRLDMEDLGTDDVVRGDGEEENADKPEEGAVAAPEFTDLDAEEAYEEMMQEEREMAEKRKRAEGDLSSPRTPHKSKSDMETDSPARSQSQTQNPTKSPGNSQAGGMTEEQIARMERNRQLAIERRLAKLGKSPAPVSKVQSSSQKVAESQDNPSDNPQPRRDQKASPSKSKAEVESGEQGTVEELEAMLNDDIGEELTGNNCDGDTMNLHLTESLDMQSEQPVTQQNAQWSRSEVEADSKEGTPQKSVSEGECNEDSDKFDLHMTATESEGIGNNEQPENSELELRLTATASEEKESVAEESDELKLRLTATETEAAELTECISDTQKLQLRLSENEVAAENSADLNIKLSETQDTNSTNVPARKESDSDNMNLRLDVSMSEEESGDV